LKINKNSFLKDKYNRLVDAGALFNGQGERVYFDDFK